MSDNVEFRNGNSQDEEWMFQLFRRTMRHYIETAWGWDETLQKESFTATLPIKQFLIITLDDEPIGGYHLSEKTDHLVLDMILVEPDHQHQGRGRSMLDRIKAEAMKLEKPIRLSVLKTNPAVDFHLEAGFEEFESDEHSIKMLWRV